MLQYKIGCPRAVVYEPDKFLRKAEISILVLIKYADTWNSNSLYYTRKFFLPAAARKV